MLLLALAAIQFTHIVDFMIMMPLGPQFMEIFAIGPQRFGFLVSAYALAASAGGFCAAFVIDRFDRKHALLVLYAGLILATVACGLAPSYGALLAARFAAGAFGGVIGALVFAVVADLVPYARRGRASALIAASFSLAAVAGVPLGLLLAQAFGWRATFLTLGALSVAVLLVAAKQLPALRGHISGSGPLPPLRQLAEVFGHANHLRAFAFVAALMFAGFSVIPFVAPYLVTTVRIDESALPLVYLTGGVATLVSSQIIGRLADRFGKKRVFAGVAALSVVPIVVLTNLPPVPLTVALAVSGVFFVFVTGRFAPAMALVSGSVEPRLRGSFMSFNAAIQQMGSGLASLVGGAILVRGSDGGFLRYEVVGAVAVAFTLLCIWLATTIRVVQDGSVAPGKE